MVMVMAEIYTECGRYDEALDELEHILSLETGTTVNELMLQWWIEPLKDLPRYQQLTEMYRL